MDGYQDLLEKFFFVSPGQGLNSRNILLVILIWTPVPVRYIQICHEIHKSSVFLS